MPHSRAVSSRAGGTWNLFRYPGIRSDSDMHTMGYRFRPWRGEKAIAAWQESSLRVAWVPSGMV
jgi:cation diffusion facilitator CzcD-associated flavoprotein CzcO